MLQLLSQGTKRREPPSQKNMPSASRSKPNLHNIQCEGKKKLQSKIGSIKRRNNIYESNHPQWIDIGVALLRVTYSLMMCQKPF